MDQLAKIVGSDGKTRHFRQCLLSTFKSRKVLISGSSRGLGLEMVE